MTNNNVISSLNKYMFFEERFKSSKTPLPPTATASSTPTPPTPSFKPVVQMPRSIPIPHHLNTNINTPIVEPEPKPKPALVSLPTPPPTHSQVVVATQPSNKEASKNHIQSSMFIPREKDKLFWCFYIMKNGLEEYKNLGHINIVIEKRIKIEYIEFLRTQKLLLKSHKMAPLTHVENFLLNESKIDMKTFLALCVSESLNMIYIHKNTYYELDLEKDDTQGTDSSETMVHVVTQFDSPLIHGYKLTNKHIRDGLYKIDNLNKPLKAISSYKLSELMDICKKLGIGLDVKPSKKDMYNSIVMRL